MGSVKNTDKKTRKFISIPDMEKWELIDKLAELPKYEKSFNKIINDALDYGLPLLIKAEFGDIKDNAKSIQMTENEIKLISGQKPILTKAKKSVANFKVREGQTVGIKVTLRGERMYNFYDKFVSIALPRLRDFRGVPDKAFDGRGNYSVGLKEQLIFPEITYDQVEKIRGMDVAIVTTANTDEEARELLKALGMPFKK